LPARTCKKKKREKELVKLMINRAKVIEIKYESKRTKSKTMMMSSANGKDELSLSPPNVCCDFVFPLFRLPVIDSRDSDAVGR